MRTDSGTIPCRAVTGCDHDSETSVYFDCTIAGRRPLSERRHGAARVERIGFDALWSFEIRHDPFFPLLEAALATERLRIGTNIAVAFARTPFSMAVSAWDLQAVSRGRLLLGLGTQVRPHVERRFSAEFDHPAARVVDYIDCLRAIWSTFQTGARPSYEGRFYRFTLINDFFNPGPIDHPDIPIYLAGVNPRDGRCRGGGGRRVQRTSHAFAGISPRGHPPCRSPKVRESAAGRHKRSPWWRAASWCAERPNPSAGDRSSRSGDRSRSTHRHRVTGHFWNSTASSTLRSGSVRSCARAASTRCRIS